MSETLIAVTILPFLIALTVVLECTRVGCSRVARTLREARSRSSTQRSPDSRQTEVSSR